MIQLFDDTALRNISDVISEILTHSKITYFFNTKCIIEMGGNNKKDRVFHALKEKQKQDLCGNNVLGFIVEIINPRRYSDETQFEKDRRRINEKLLYEGIEILKDGTPKKVDKARTITEAKERSSKIKEKVHGITIHQNIIPFCEEEWLKENYFHAILEITKSVGERLREISGLRSDGAILVNDCFGLGKDMKSMLAFNMLKNESEESEHKGFSNFCKGFFSMYRNPKAHNPKVLEYTQLSEMIEVLIVATIIHNRLDNTFKTGYK